MPPSWKGAVALPLTLLILAALYQGTSAVDYKCFSIFDDGKGTIYPQGDIIIEVGSPYEAYCLFNPEEVHVDDVYFEATDSNRKISHTVVNSSAISVQVPNDKAANYNLRCLQGNGSFICQRTVYVGYKPQDVENFTCLSKNWQSLNCSWDVPENPVKVTYNFTYVIPGYQKLRDCPRNMTDGQNWCYWVGGDFHDKRRYWSMIFTANNSLTQDPVEFRHDIDLYATVLPNMPSRFGVGVLGPREVILQWELPHPIDVFTEGNVTHQVKFRIKPFRNMFQNSPWEMVGLWEEKPERFKRKTYNKTIRNLQPYTEYEFMVRLHTGSGPIREEMWSEPARMTKRTDAARPTVAPLTTLGMFEVEETKLHRDVYVNWKTVDPLEENGPNFTYEVRILDGDGRSVSTPVMTRNGYTKFSKLDNDITYRFEIRPKNSEGLPEDDDVKAEVIVPRKAALISIPKYFKVIAYLGNDTTTYMARWRLPEVFRASQNIETVTLYWCKQSEYENRCQNKISWKIIEDPNSYVHNLTDYDTSTRYMFGISVNSNNSSSGIKWSGCIAKHGVQQPALEKFNYTYVSSTEVKLKWDLDCKAEAAQPKAFNISYCIAAESAEECLEPEIYEEVDGESTIQHTVKNLHPYRHYLFYIATISDLGLGKWSKYRRVMTKPSKPSGPPRNLTLVGRGQTWISLAWDPPLESERNGEINSYLIKHEIKNSHGFAPIKRNVHEFNFTNLDPFTEYHFEVFPCTKVNVESACSEMYSAKIDVKTKIGVPGKIDSFQYNPPWLNWDLEECNGPNCSYLLQYTINDTTSSYDIPVDQDSVSLKDLNITCPVQQGDIPVTLRATSIDEEGDRLLGPTKEMKIRCPSKGLALWIILAIGGMCVIITLIFITIFTYGREKVKEFIARVTLDVILPSGLEPQDQSPDGKKKRYAKMPRSKDCITTPTLPLKPSEEQDLIKPGNERQHRNFSGDSGTSVADPADSSGCSTGGDSVSSSGSDRIPQSSDSGTVQEEAGFPSDEKQLVGSVRLRTPAPPYVRQGLPEKVPNMNGYVSVGSVPNLAVSATDGIPPLQQSNPSLGLETLEEVPMGGRRTSTGYISMPSNECDGMNYPLDDFVLPHERRPGDLLAYSRHYMPYKKTTDFSPYTKAQSLPWLNTGYVAVAQAEDGGQMVPGAQGYVAVGDAMNIMKRQPSLPSLPVNISKTLTTPDEDLPPGAYCKLGARGSPDPPSNSPGYVSVTQHMPVPNSLPISPPVSKSPYVTCAMAESMVSPKKDLRKTPTDYVAVGDVPDGQWAHPIIHPMTPEETREVLSAPVEGSRARAIQPVRPNSSETNHNRGSSQFAPSGHSLSKQSSGYASGNVSQETLTFHDPLVMSPKKLLARSHEPHSVVYSPNHKPSMV